MRIRRLPLLAAALLSLLAAVAGGLVRLDVWLPVPGSLAVAHGPLVVTGFLGTLIGLERAVALGGFAWAVPAATLASAALLAGNAPVPWPAALATCASAAALVVILRLRRRQPETFLTVMALGMGAWLAGNVLWLRDVPSHRIAPWWAAFFVFLIAGERLELTRLFLPTARQRTAFLLAAAVLLGGLATQLVALDAGARVAGLGFVGLALWLARHDVARRNLTAGGLSRFMAVTLLCGYAWLAFAGALWAASGHVAAGPLRDAALHGIFLGFVFAMILAHAPVIFPSIMGVPMTYSPSFYVPFAVLEATLVLRLASDLLFWEPGRRWGAIGNAAAIVLFVANTARVVLRTARTRRG